MMNIEKDRLNHALFLLMEFHIARYLMSNTCGRWDGSEKALRHLDLSYIYVASQRLISIDEAQIATTDEDDFRADFIYKAIHDATQELTDNMDEVIGFPLEDRHPDHGVLIPKFFDEFIRLADIAYSKL